MLSYLEFEHGAQLLLPDLQGANFVGKIHDGGVETLVLLLKGRVFHDFLACQTFSALLFYVFPVSFTS